MAGIKVSQSSYNKIQQLSSFRLFDAVRVYPDRVTFDGQDGDEQIILFLRQHPIVFIPTILRSLGLLMLFIFLTWVFGTLFGSLVQVGALGFIIFVGGIGVAITSIVYDFFKWYFTVTIVTSTRLVDLDFQTVMDSRWSTTVLRAIQDVSYSTPGFINTIFDMANLVILTASHKENFELANLPKARDVQDILMDLVENEKRDVPDDESV
ncbi:hypothetical protein IT418_01095 [bacterium]|nr:hypothetical protein [bacterium]